ncbi:MAG TPA: hypothetical protein VKM93_04000 [Terriglobia bacterium]|nr:hypothetical protein [Terriglobia bacterium]
METLSTTTKMQQLDAKNPGLLAILDEHLDKRKRPSWIAGKLSSRYLVAVTIQDIVDYIGQKWAKAAEPGIGEHAGVGNRESGIGEKRQPEKSRPVCPIPSTVCPSQAESGIGSGESGIGEKRQPEKSRPVCPMPSTVCQSKAEAEIGAKTTQPEGPVESCEGAARESGVLFATPGSVLATPASATPDSLLPTPVRVLKAKPPKRASTKPRKRRAELLELQVTLVQTCLIEGPSRMDSLGG